MGQRILEATNVVPAFTVDGGAAGGDAAQLVKARRKYLAWLRKNVDFIPTLCPEELVLRAAGKVDPTAMTAQHHKDRLRSLAVDVYGADASNDRTDQYGEALLALSRDNSAELRLIAQRLVQYLASLQAQQ